MTDYDVHLVRAKQFGLERTVTEYLPLAASLFCLVQLSVIMFFFRPLRQMFDFRADVPSLNRSVFGNVRLGFGVVPHPIAFAATGSGPRQCTRTRLIRAWLVYFLSFFGFAKRLLRFHREEFEIRKSVSPVKSMAKKVQIEFTS
jgi:hypothetical protein